ncbi:hypothetical protein [Methylobacterium oryzisoli]|uniref:hypothetical protein n=1 Tax=Methylobacterium oryzisoli TaxID=3385502 RepID=UPI003891B5FA
MAPFDHALSQDFLEALRKEVARGGWWRDVLADPTLVIATRGRSLNVYWKGQSLFRASLVHGAIRVTTHEKFLLNPALEGQVPLNADGLFDIAALTQKGFLDRYEDKETLKKLKAAAGRFADAEKSGCHEIAVRNAGVIDVEIAFPGKYVIEETETTAPRVDLAAVESDGSDARLVFWEAKTYDNGDLRTLTEEKPATVCGQVGLYRSILAQHREAVEASYARVAANLVAFRDMGWTRPLSPAIEAVGRNTATLRLHDEPAVGLIVFGFDKGQRDEARWVGHRSKLQQNIARVKLIGDPKQIRI